MIRTAGVPESVAGLPSAKSKIPVASGLERSPVLNQPWQRSLSSRQPVIQNQNIKIRLADVRCLGQQQSLGTSRREPLVIDHHSGLLSYLEAIH